MSSETGSIPDVPEAVLKQKSNFLSAVWVIPIISALIGGWLVFESATEVKAVAEVTFKAASGLEAGESVVKARNVKVGDVTEIRFSDDLSEVVVVMEFKGIKQELLTDSARFWVVRPRIGVGGVSGLDTLVSGAYIEVDPGEAGQPTKKYVGLEEPQIHQLGNPGTKYILSTDVLGSISSGAPVKFRGIEVGSVTRYQLSEDHSHVEVEIFVRAPHDKYVKQKTRFWDVSGLDVKVDAEGIQLELDSIASLLAGGIAFSTKNDSDAIVQAAEETIFNLYKTEKPAFEEALTFGAPMKLYFDKGVSGLSVDAPVTFKGMRVGSVLDIGVEINADETDLLTFAMINVEPDRLPISERKTGFTDEQFTKVVYHYFETLVKNGMRAQLKTRNLITGQSLVALGIFPGADKARLKYVNGMPIMPTVPETLSGLLEQVDIITARFAAMPIEEISHNLEEATASINDLSKSFNAADGGVMGVQMYELMGELSRAARSIRSMSEYLERHPEALIKGKSAE